MTTVISIKQNGEGKQGLQPCSFVPAESVLTGEANEIGEIHYESEGGKVLVGSWESTPYSELLNCNDHSEFSQVLSGKITLTGEDGNVTTFTSGQSFVLPVGWKGKFEVIETARKNYVISYI